MVYEEKPCQKLGGSTTPSSARGAVRIVRETGKQVVAEIAARSRG
jgi:hypothetical protein